MLLVVLVCLLLLLSLSLSWISGSFLELLSFLENIANLADAEADTDDSYQGKNVFKEERYHAVNDR